MQPRNKKRYNNKSEKEIKIKFKKLLKRIDDIKLVMKIGKEKEHKHNWYSNRRTTNE